MIVRYKIEKADDVMLTIPISQFRVILKEIDDLKRDLVKEEDEWEAARNRHIKEYARTGRVVEFDHCLAEAQLVGHAADCSIWDGDKLYGEKCNCGKWSDD